MPSNVSVSGLNFTTQITVEDGQDLLDAIRDARVNTSTPDGQPLTIKVNDQPYSGQPVQNGDSVTALPPKLSHG